MVLTKDEINKVAGGILLTLGSLFIIFPLREWIIERYGSAWWIGVILIIIAIILFQRKR